jgi:HK97 family phage major capsid protein
MATTNTVGGVELLGGSRLERQHQQYQRLAARHKLICDRVARESRDATAEEETELKSLEQQLSAITAQIERTEADQATSAQVDDLYRRASGPTGARHPHGLSAGQLFAEATSAFFTKGQHRARQWATEAIEVPYGSLFATTLTEGAGSGGALVVPQYLPGILPTATRRIVVMDLLGQGITNSNAIVYMKETTFTNAATPTAEGAAKPESALIFAQVSEPVLKIAHWLPVTEELLEDVGAIASYIDSRLRLGVQLAEDDQVLNGNGTPPNFVGILNRAGLATTIVQGAAPDTAADAILRQISAISVNAMTAPTGIVMNPADWQSMLVLKSTLNTYIGPSPFEQPQVPTLWGLPVALTVSIPAKTALVGAFSTMAQFFRRGGLRVESSNAHQDFFIRDLVAIRAEERGALAVYRPNAFGKVTLT